VGKQRAGREIMITVFLYSYTDVPPFMQRLADARLGGGVWQAGGCAKSDRAAGFQKFPIYKTHLSTVIFRHFSFKTPANKRV
jgi:hypothetical protein